MYLSLHLSKLDWSVSPPVIVVCGIISIQWGAGERDHHGLLCIIWSVTICKLHILMFSILFLWTGFARTLFLLSSLLLADLKRVWNVFHCCSLRIYKCETTYKYFLQYCYKLWTWWTLESLWCWHSCSAFRLPKAPVYQTHSPEPRSKVHASFLVASVKKWKSLKWQLGLPLTRKVTGCFPGFIHPGACPSSQLCVFAWLCPGPMQKCGPCCSSHQSSEGWLSSKAKSAWSRTWWHCQWWWWPCQ